VALPERARLVALVRPESDGSQPDDAALVARAVDGDRWAEEALYRRHAEAITAAVIRMVGRDADADDIVQETFVTAFERLRSLREGAAFRSWTARIALNEVRKTLRKRKLRRLVGLDRGPDGGSFEALAVDGVRPDLRAELAELDRVVAKLPTEQRMIWLLHRVEGWSIRETAESVGCSTATVKRRLSAADAAVDVARTGRGFSL